MCSLTIIIPCHNNSLILPWILRSVKFSGILDIEVILVDDGSREDIASIAKQYNARYVRLPDGPPGRRALARKCGHELSKTLLSFYLDGDVIPEPRIFRLAKTIHSQMRTVVVKYPVYSIAEGLHFNSLQNLAHLIITQDLSRLGPNIQKNIGVVTRPLPKRLRGRKTRFWVLCASHCTSYERSQIESVGGWDQNFLGWGEEDIELAYRLHLSGVRFVYPHRKYGAAYHLNHPVNWNKNLSSLDKNLEYFLQKYPESWSGRISMLKRYLDEHALTYPPVVTNRSLAMKR